jgi:hypothetical protein
MKHKPFSAMPLLGLDLPPMPGGVRSPLGEIRDADVDTFIEYLVPGITKTNLGNVKVEHRAWLRKELNQVMAEHYESGSGIQGVIEELGTWQQAFADFKADKKTAAVLSRERITDVGAEHVVAKTLWGAFQAGVKNTPVSLIGVASFALVAGITAIIGFHQMAVSYNKLLISWSRGLATQDQSRKEEEQFQDFLKVQEPHIRDFYKRPLKNEEVEVVASAMWEDLGHKRPMTTTTIKSIMEKFNNLQLRRLMSMAGNLSHGIFPRTRRSAHALIRIWQ